MILGFSTTGLVSFDIPLRREALLIEKTKSWESDIFRRAPNSSRLVASACKVQGLLLDEDDHNSLAINWYNGNARMLMVTKPQR